MEPWTDNRSPETDNGLSACLTSVSQVDKQDFVTIFERCSTSFKNVAKIDATSIPTPTPASLLWGLQYGTPSESSQNFINTNREIV